MNLWTSGKKYRTGLSIVKRTANGITMTIWREVFRTPKITLDITVINTQGYPLKIIKKQFYKSQKQHII